MDERLGAIIRGREKKKIYGYVRFSETLGRLLDFILSLILLIVGIPLFVIIGIAVKLCDGGPIFYTQKRLGYQKKPFTIYKFRTLIPNADKIIGNEVLGSKHRMMTPIGKFLRNTRLDELPQLINILKGDMSFFGPRPQRPEIVEHFGIHIKGYDKRFTVKPGLIGFPQLFLPHSAPKEIQSRIDNMYLRYTQKYFWRILLILFTIYNVLKKFIVIGTNRIYHTLIEEKILRRYREKRYLERKKLKEGAWVYFLEAENQGKRKWGKTCYELVDINEEALLIKSPEKLHLEHEKVFLKIVVHFKAMRKYKRKSIVCRGSYYSERNLKNGYGYIFFYEPLSPLNFYLIHQYLLRKSLAYG